VRIIKRGEYLKDKIDELAMNSKFNIRNLYRGIFKRGYRHRSNLVRDENGDLLPDSHNILNRWNNYFSQLLIVYSVHIRAVHWSLSSVSSIQSTQTQPPF
jgi:hypothetical protein